jgi:PAS domain S-box-containing protein
MVVAQKDTIIMTNKIQPLSEKTMDEKINNFVKSMFDKVLIHRNSSILKEYFSDDVCFHGLIEGEEFCGLQELRKFIIYHMEKKIYTFSSNRFKNEITEFSPNLYGANIQSEGIYKQGVKGEQNIRISAVIIYEDGTLKFKDISLSLLSKTKGQTKEDSTYSKLKSVFEASPSPTFVKDLEGHYILANTEFLDFYHIKSLDDVIGFTDEVIMDKQASIHCRITDKQAMMENRTITVGEEYLDEYGSQKFIQVSKKPIYEEGILIGLIGYIHDVTSLKTISKDYASSETEIEYVFNQSEVGFFVKDDDGKFTRVNKAFVELFGVEEHDILGKTDDEIDWKNNNENVKAINDMIAESSNHECTHFIYDEDFNQKYLSIEERPLLRKTDHSGVFGVCRDISKSIAKKIELNKRYTNSIKYRKDTLAFVVVDLDDMLIKECYTRNDELSLSNKPYTEAVYNLFASIIIYENDRNDFYYHFFPTNLANNFNLEEKYSFKCDMVTFIKTSMTANISVDYSFNIETNHKEAYVFVTDIFKERQMREIVEHVNSSEYDFIARINSKIDTVEYIISNQSPIIERVGTLTTIQSFLDCIYESNGSRSISDKEFLANIETNLEMGNDYRYTVDFANGKRKSTIVKPVDRENCVYLIMVQDITAITKKDRTVKKALEAAAAAAEEANKSKSDFLARMSHDMRTPLNGIIGLSDFGLKESKDPSIQDYFSKIASSSKFLLSLINDVLDIQSIENGKFRIYSLPIITKECFDGIGVIISSRAKEKNIKLSISKTEYAPKYIMGDCLRLQQIFSNILGNSIKYTPNDGCISWDISYIKRNNKNISRHVISDNGIGMSKEFQKHMFESFAIEPNKYSQSERSSGLGLAIVKTMIELMGGTIKCTSELNKGTTFEIELPLEIISEKEYEESLIHEESKAVTLSDKQILLCEDNKINVMITKKILEQHHIMVDVAENGLIGVDKLRNGKYDAILMDIRMPIMDGITAAKKIREFDKLIPIIAVSANAYEEDKKKSITSGMNAHISKPINQMDLINTLQDLL